MKSIANVFILAISLCSFAGLEEGDQIRFKDSPEAIKRCTTRVLSLSPESDDLFGIGGFPFPERRRGAGADDRQLEVYIDPTFTKDQIKSLSHKGNIRGSSGVGVVWKRTTTPATSPTSSGP
jgi:hypothetical protein